MKFSVTCCLLASYIVTPGPAAVWLELFESTNSMLLITDITFIIFISSSYSMIVWVRVVLKRTVVGD